MFLVFYDLDFPFFYFSRSVGVPIAFDQNTPQEETPEERVVELAPEQVAAPAPAQEPIVVPTAPLEVEVQEKSQQVPTSAGPFKKGFLRC